MTVAPRDPILIAQLSLQTQGLSWSELCCLGAEVFRGTEPLEQLITAGGPGGLASLGL